MPSSFNVNLKNTLKLTKQNMSENKFSFSKQTYFLQFSIYCINFSTFNAFSVISGIPYKLIYRQLNVFIFSSNVYS